MSDPLPFIDEHTRPTNADPDMVWDSLLRMIRRRRRSGRMMARLLASDPVEGTVSFEGLPGDAIPGFRIIEAEPSRLLALRGRHRFAEYALTFIIEDGSLRAQTYARFPGLAGRIYRSLVIGSGGHRLVVGQLLRQAIRSRK